MSQERNFKGVWIPKSLWITQELTWMEKLFFIEIDYLDNDKHCFASNGYFADFFNLSKGRVSQIITSMAKKGYLDMKTIRRKGSPEVERRVLSLTKAGKDLLTGEMPLVIAEGGLGSDEDNNIVNNNISKDIYTLPEEVVVETKKEYNLKNKDLIEYYNELPNVQKHKIPKSGKISKVLERIDRYLINLKAGTFSKKIKSQQTYNKKWHTLKKLDILMKKKFTDDEIKEMLNNINNYFDPKSLKSGDKKGLDVMLFNPTDTSGKSLALWLYKYPPTVKNIIIADKYPKITSAYRKIAFMDYSWSDTMQKDLVMACNRVGDFLASQQSLLRAHSYPQMEIGAIPTIHAKWIRDSVGGSYAISSLLKMDMENGFFKNFVQHFKKVHGFNLMPNEKELLSSKGTKKYESKMNRAESRAKERERLRAVLFEQDIETIGSRLDMRIDFMADEDIESMFGEQDILDLTAYNPPEEEYDDYFDE